jgi:hypothetical protein
MQLLRVQWGHTLPPVYPTKTVSVCHVQKSLYQIHSTHHPLAAKWITVTGHAMLASTSQAQRVLAVLLALTPLLLD